MTNKRTYLILIILLLTLSSISFAEDSLSITHWMSRSQLLENGDLSISEDITFNFKDKFNGVYRHILLKDIDGIEALEIFEVENGIEIPYNFVNSAEKGESNVFTAKEKDNLIQIMIFSPSKNEEKTFRIKYIVKNVAVKHIDTGELYYSFIGKGNETKIDNLEITIELPGKDRTNTKIFAHGPLKGRINFLEDDLIQLKVSNVPSNTYIEGRILFPLEFIKDSSNKGNNNLDRIVDEELRLIKVKEEKAATKEAMKGIFNNISLILGAIGALIFAYVFNKLRRNEDVYDSLKNLNPDDITPGELRLFYFSLVDARSLMTTIFDLARKGYIDIGEIESKKKKKKDFQFINTHKSQDGLLSHEKFVLDLLFNTIGDGNVTNTIEIENYRKKNYSAFYKNTNTLSKKVKEDLNLWEYYDDKGKPYGFLTLILSIILFVIGIIAVINDGLYGIVSLVLSMILFIYSITLFLRKSDKGYIQYQLWKDFIKDMKSQGNILNDYNITIPRDKMLIYALALGLPMKSLDSFKDVMPEANMSNHWVYWYFMTNSRGGSSFEDRFNSSFYGNTGTSSSSSTGAGGGFSSGGGGGAGGGGAGGF